MRIAIMQPYIFPYVGYFQLMRAVERFICLDDVAFITRGWINRNRLLSNGRPGWFTVPLVKASQNRDIDATLVHQAVYAGWRENFSAGLRRITAGRHIILRGVNWPRRFLPRNPAVSAKWRSAA